MQENQVQSLGQEDPLKKEMATHSSILAWEILWREEPGGLYFVGLQWFGLDWVTSLSLFTRGKWKFSQWKVFLTPYRIAWRTAITVTWLDYGICEEMWRQKQQWMQAVVNVMSKNLDFILRLAFPKMCSGILTTFFTRRMKWLLPF